MAVQRRNKKVGAIIKPILMKTAGTSNTIVEGYAGLLGNLSVSNRLDLIAKLTASVKMDLISTESSFKKSFGALDSESSAKVISTSPDSI